MPYGFDDGLWDDAKHEAKHILIRKASRGQVIAYSDLVRQLESITIDAHDLRLGHFLGEISAEEDDTGRGLLTVLVVHKGGDLKPGPGFFDLASRRGRDVTDIERCFNEEMRFVHAVHGWNR